LFKIQQRELQDYHQKRDRLTIDLNIAVEENEVCKSTKNLKKIFVLSF
jgi:hypothetical protein